MYSRKQNNILSVYLHTCMHIGIVIGNIIINTIIIFDYNY